MTSSSTGTVNMAVAVSDSADAGTDDTSGDESAVIDEVRSASAGERVRRSGGSPRRVSISVSARSVLYGVLIAILLGALGTFAWLYLGARHELDAQAHRTADYARAEQVALDYAVKAATMNFEDLNAWKANLVAGTSADLNDRLTEAADSMEQIVLPLKWSSSAQPLTAKVHSENDGIFIVDCFVSVQTKTVQAPDALQSTATYRLTIDSNKNWEITDVGGIGSLVGQK